MPIYTVADKSRTTMLEEEEWGEEEDHESSRGEGDIVSVGVEQLTVEIFENDLDMK